MGRFCKLGGIGFEDLRSLKAWWGSGFGGFGKFEEFEEFEILRGPGFEESEEFEVLGGDLDLKSLNRLKMWAESGFEEFGKSLKTWEGNVIPRDCKV